MTTEAELALERLARRLYEEMERLDPSDGVPWDALSPREREFYRLSLSPVLESRDDLATMLHADA